MFQNKGSVRLSQINKDIAFPMKSDFLLKPSKNGHLKNNNNNKNLTKLMHACYQ